jgi:hypothetical protein
METVANLHFCMQGHDTTNATENVDLEDVSTQNGDSSAASSNYDGNQE